MFLGPPILIGGAESNEETNMDITIFERELTDIHKDFKIIRNSKAVGLATVFFKGQPLFAIPSEGIYDEPQPGYGLELPTGSFVRHRTRPEALAFINNLVLKMKSDPDYFEAMMGLGKYSDASLR